MEVHLYIRRKPVRSHDQRGRCGRYHQVQLQNKFRRFFNGWWFGTFFCFPIYWEYSSQSQLTFIFFRGVAQPPTSLSRWCNSIRELLGPWFHDSQIPCWKQHSRYQAATCFPSVLPSRHGDLRVDHGAWTWNTSPSYPIDLGVSNHTLDVCPTSLPQLSHCHPTIIYHYLPTCFLYH